MPLMFGHVIFAQGTGGVGDTRKGVNTKPEADDDVSMHVVEHVAILTVDPPAGSGGRAGFDSDCVDLAAISTVQNSKAFK